LPPDQASLCEGHLTLGQGLSALQGVTRGKAPGLDGLPMDLKFWNVVAEDLVSVLTHAHR